VPAVDAPAESSAETPAMRRTIKELRRPALFVDRDGTLIVDRHYLRDPRDVELVPAAANVIRRFNNVLHPVIVVTNQSGIARGRLSETDYQAVRERVDDLIEANGACIDDHYHCPHHPDITGPCACRKPAIGLYEQAIIEHQLDGKGSVFVGDRLRDVLPATVYGARGILIPAPDTPVADIERARALGFDILETFSEVAVMVLGTPQDDEEP
jgi:histidinol-phosphate phosphatase family protein